MIKNLQITLYEIFGYFLPGVVAFGALAVSAWALFWPESVIHIATIPIEFWVFAGFASYFLGHAMHAAGNIFGQPENSAFDEPVKVTSVKSFLLWAIGSSSNRPEWYSEAIVESARKKAAEVLDVKPSEITNQLLFSACDEALSQTGEIGDREIYQYRGGFYKSMAIALIVALTALSACLIHPSVTVQLGDKAVPQLSRVHYLAVTFLTFFVLLFYVRKYCWFAQHRARRAILGFLVISNRSKQTQASAAHN